MIALQPAANARRKKSPDESRAFLSRIACAIRKGDLPATSAAAATTTSVTATAVATATATAAARTSTAATAAGLVLSLVDTQRTTAHVLAVQALNGAGRIGLVHLDKSEAARTTRIAIGRQGDGLNSTVLREQRADVRFARSKRQVSNIDLRHD
jgi:hypothetical protein